MSDKTPKTTEERQRALEGVILKHARFKEAFTSIGRLGSRATAPGGELAGRARVVIGDSGAGKTQLLRAIEREPWAQPMPGVPHNRLPLLYVEVPDRVTPREIVVTTMRALGEPLPTKSQTKEDILQELVVVFRQVGLRVLLFDEAHWLMKSHSLSVREANAEFIKSMLNRTGVHMVLAGTKELAQLHSFDVAQTRRRLLTKVFLRPYNWSVAGERAAFQTILKLYEKAIGYFQGSDFWKTDMARRLYLVSGGELGVVVQYLSSAIELVDAAGGRAIGAEVLAAVHDGLSMELREQMVGDMDAFVESMSDSIDNPFSCDEKALKELWQARFSSTIDKSRQTKLGAGKPSGV